MNITTSAVTNAILGWGEKGLGALSNQIGNIFKSSVGIWITLGVIGFIIYKIVKR